MRDKTFVELYEERTVRRAAKTSTGGVCAHRQRHRRAVLLVFLSFTHSHTATFIIPPLLG